MLLGGVTALVLPALALSIVAVVGGLCLILIGVLIVSAATRLRRVNASATTIVM
jgi:uncharacterized membrane protein HdeD (DUF308 family)